MDAPDDLIITMDDCRKAGHCAAGVRTWFRDQGLDFRAFMKNGIPASEFLASGDGQAEQVYARKLEREMIGADLTGLVITAEDVQAAGKCALGSRSFARRASLDFSSYLKTGIPAVDLVATGDPEALDVVRHKLRHG